VTGAFITLPYYNMPGLDWRLNDAFASAPTQIACGALAHLLEHGFMTGKGRV
jgi:hypothetical protein